ncbi:tetratricopeptide repeat protein [Kribbella kalugense]|uniref:Tetratricopeptide repeat protein n=1 Tax=Kribbella kalugense TaxID=2512221 RepID=A0A4V3G7F8_9ACTN|nr:tetratricopeptide repeat protein [Kribbella kalugense]TDW18944.1 tetratricopeptide repeat protein [Kribbella kalugense]
MTEPARNEFSGSAQFVVQAGSITGDVNLGGLSVWVAPSQLPPASRAFVGRDHELAMLDSALLPGGAGVALVTGAPGTGKTELALQWASTSVDAFEDGFIYLDLQGWGVQSPVPAEVAVGDVLMSLGVRPADLPPGLPARRSMFRTRIAGRKLLLLLDNVRSSADVASLMPGSSSCSVLVTSRHDLSSLVIRQGAVRVRLGELESSEAVQLLSRFVGSRGDAETARLETLASLCGRLPLALVMAAETFVTRPEASVTSVVEELSGEGDRLPKLRSTDQGLDVREVISWSYGLLDGLSRRAFLGVGVIPGRSFTPGVVAAVTGLSAGEASSALRRLAGSHLIFEVSVNRYQAHDILRLFASETSRDELGEVEMLVGWKRLCDYYLLLARRADALIAPGRFQTGIDEDDSDLDECVVPDLDDPQDALRLLNTERLNVVATCRLEHPALDRRLWRLAQLYRGYFFLTKQLDSWLEVQLLAVDAAVRSGDRDGEAMARGDLGLALDEQRQGTAALEQFERADRIFAEQGNEHGRHTMMGRKARILRSRGDPRAAKELLETALTFYQAAGNRRNSAITLRSLALAELDCGDIDQSVAHLRESARICAADGLDLEGAMSQNSLGTALVRAGDRTGAETAYRSALAAANECGATYEEARALRGLAALLVDIDEAGAVQYLEKARVLLAGLASPELADVERQLQIILGRPPTAD